MAKQKPKPLWEINKENIVNADKEQTINGAHVIKIKEAVTNVTNNGARWVDFTIEIPDRLDREGNPKQYSIRRWYIISGNDKDNTMTFKGDILNSLMYLTKTKPIIDKRKAVVWEDGVQIEKNVDQFVELINKEVGAVIQKEYKWRRKKINGYTKEEKNFEDVRQDTDVWIDDYEKDPKLLFDITRFFCHKGKYRGWVASEMIKDKDKDTKEEVKPTKLKRALERIVTYEYDRFGNPVLPKMTNEQIYEYIKKQLKNQLGSDFDKSKVEPFKGAELEEMDDVPF